MKKALSLLILFAVLIGSISCGASPETLPSVTDDSGPAAGTTAEPEPERNFNGADFNVLIRKEWAYEFDIEQQTGDLVNDAVYQRNLTVADRYNAKIAFTQVDGGWDEREIFLNVLNSAVLAGDDSFDMVAGYQAYIVTPALQGLFLNVLDLDSIDPDADWWSQKCSDSITVNGKLHMITGDIALTLWESIYVMVFNKSIAGQHGIGDVYGAVNDGKWTLDAFGSMAAMVSGDLDGDGKYTDTDLYGYASSNDNHVKVWFVPVSVQIVSRGDDGFMKMSFRSERAQNALEKLVDIYKAQSTYGKFDTFDETYIGYTDSNMFTENQVLFASAYLQTASRLRSMDTDFGIIPLPKYDENQDEYITTVHDSTSMICFPVTARDPEMSAFLTEALCRESSAGVVPVYYEGALKSKYSRDTESAAMIDLIRDSVTFDFGAVYTVPMGGIVGFFGTLISEGKTDFASAYASRESAYEAKLEEINAAFRE